MRYITTIISTFLLLSCSVDDDSTHYDKGRLIKSVVVDYILIDEDDKEVISDSENIVFGYDDSFRVTSVKLTKGKSLVIKYYDDMIIETSDSHSIDNNGVEVKNILNTDGLVVRGEKMRKEVLLGETIVFPKSYTLTYNGDGYLMNSEIVTYNSDMPVKTAFVWSGGNLTKTITEESYRDSVTPNINNILFSYADCKNESNIDLNVILTGCSHSLLDFPALIRKTGKGSKSIVSKVVDRHEIPSKFWDQSTCKFELELDDRGSVVKVKRYFTFCYSSQPTDQISDELLDAIYTITYSE